MENSNQKVIAAFDFDGTITTKDTLIDYLIFYWGKNKILLGFIILSPILILFKLKLIRNNKAKEILFSYFFKNIKIEDFDKKCDLYSKKVETICKPNIIEKIKWHLAQSHEVIIISASIKNWIEPWAINNEIKDVIATEITVVNNIITGKFKTKNCYGQEKVNRFLKKYPNRESYILYAYGDSRGDKELLDLADHSQYIK